MPAFAKDRLDRLHNVLAQHVREGRMPGLVAALSRDGETYLDTIGHASFEQTTPMRRDTIFRLASVTKPIVAVAAMILLEEGRFQLDDPIDPWLPELADRRVLRTFESDLDDTVPAKRPISVRDLLTFRLGYGFMISSAHYPIQSAIEAAHIAPAPRLPELPPDDLLRAYGALPLIHQPGEAFLYNSGSDILGVLIARIADSTLSAFMRERIFDPLGMKDTGFSVPARAIDRLAGCYLRNGETGELEAFDAVGAASRWASPPVFESGSGGLVSTVDDLLTFGEMMLGKGQARGVRVLARRTVELMTTDQITAEQKARSTLFPNYWHANGWGFGVGIATRLTDLAATPGRFGWDGAYGTSWYVDPAEGLVGVLLTQRVWEASSAPRERDDFWNLAYAALE